VSVELKYATRKGVPTMSEDEALLETVRNSQLNHVHDLHSELEAELLIDRLPWVTV
jgi:hypothetical protein